MPELITRRRLLGATAFTAAGLVSGCMSDFVPVAHEAFPRTPDEALDRLLTGNLRFARGEALHPFQSPADRRQLTQGQQPFAAIVGCVDSRVPPEIVLDQGLGDLLVMRTAGQVLDDAVLGSIEYGVGHLGIPLVLVLGHERCGAVAATIEALDSGHEAEGHVADLVAAITPAVERATGEGEARLDSAVIENVRLVAEQVRTTPAVAERVEAGAVKVVGSRYDLDRGRIALV